MASDKEEFKCVKVEALLSPTIDTGVFTLIREETEDLNRKMNLISLRLGDIERNMQELFDVMKRLTKRLDDLDKKPENNKTKKPDMKDWDDVNSISVITVEKERKE